MHKCLKGIIIIPFFIFSLGLWAQVNSVSPYSRLGLGDLVPITYSRNIGFGGASMGLPQPLNVDISNPASYTQLQLVNLEAGFEAAMVDQRQSNPDRVIENGRSGFRYLTFGLPITDWWGTAVGLKPYSFKGYQINTSRTLPSDASVRIEDNFSGSGGVNRVYWGNAFKVAEGLSLGINTSFLFGSVEEQQTIDFSPNNFLDTRTDDETTLKGVYLEYGLQYQYSLNNNRFLGAGISFANQSKLNAEITRYQYTLDGRTPVDTLSGGISRNSQITLPTEFKVGISYGKNHPQIMNPAWAVSLDYELYNGSEFVNASGGSPLENGYKVQLGGFVVPRYTIKAWERSPLYFNNIEYRFGAYYEKTPLMLAGNEIPDYGITFGVGLPINQKRASPGELKITTLNVGAQLGRRGTLSDGLILEEYLSFYIGVTFNDKWFLDYKYR